MNTPLTMATLPTISDARLPDTYQHAVTALEHATAIDECQSWADKAMALASYARQSRDDRLHRMAIRIQARATRRCGELLATVPRNPGGSPTHKATRAGGNPSSPSSEFVTDGLKRVDGIYAAGHDANMSTGQIKAALRVAAVPKADFERQVESDAPPTVTTLAQQGKRVRPLVDLEGIDPADFASATQAQGALNRLADYCDAHDPARIARAFKPHERQALRNRIAVVDAWLDRFVVNLPE
jgi:hypothetical protein